MISTETCIVGKTAYISYLHNSLLQLFSAIDTLKLSPAELFVHIPQNQLTSGMSPIYSFIIYSFSQQRNTDCARWRHSGPYAQEAHSLAHSACPTVWELLSDLLLCHKTTKGSCIAFLIVMGPFPRDTDLASFPLLSYLWCHLCTFHNKHVLVRFLHVHLH